ncbi:hypothetical protein L1987_19904 [Smallanthus sonchifolius]|uniref:Uncharacterized protein n=1 Tax=Smallanthus sonchifolius TaxID=185202 RepID=A0ACB9IQC4_9ASTR|nr:hypothetical protein L1987_19904 [Smallanthus sonchifolius]
MGHSNHCLVNDVYPIDHKNLCLGRKLKALTVEIKKWRSIERNKGEKERLELEEKINRLELMVEVKELSQKERDRPRRN